MKTTVGIPPDLTEVLDAAAAREGWPWIKAWKLALRVGLIAIEDNGGLLKTADTLTFAPSPAGGNFRIRDLPRDATALVSLAEREGVRWQAAQRIAVRAGLRLIEARGGLTETKRQIEAAEARHMAAARRAFAASAVETQAA